MGYVAAAFVMVIGLFLLWSSLVLFSRAQRTRSFVPVPGRVIERSIVDVPGGTGPPRFGPKVKYAYHVDGRELVGDRYALVQTGYDMKRAERELAKVPNDLTVYVNPHDPADAIVDRRGSGLAVITSGLGIISAIALLIFAMQ